MKCSSTEEYEKTIDFYKNILEIPVAREWQAGIMLDTGNGIVEIFNDGDDAPGKGVIRHFAFATDDVDACVEAVKAAGYEVFIEPKDIEIASTPVFPARTGRPNGSSLFTLIHTPPVDSTMEAAVPSPPSATWSLSISQSGIAASMPSSIAAATCSDDKEPLNLSDAMTTFINTLFCRSCHSTYGMP